MSEPQRTGAAPTAQKEPQAQNHVIQLLSLYSALSHLKFWFCVCGCCCGVCGAPAAIAALNPAVGTGTFMFAMFPYPDPVGPDRSFWHPDRSADTPNPPIPAPFRFMFTLPLLVLALDGIVGHEHVINRNLYVAHLHPVLSIALQGD